MTNEHLTAIAVTENLTDEQLINKELAQDCF